MHTVNAAISPEVQKNDFSFQILHKHRNVSGNECIAWIYHPELLLFPFSSMCNLQTYLQETIRLKALFSILENFQIHR